MVYWNKKLWLKTCIEFPKELYSRKVTLIVKKQQKNNFVRCLNTAIVLRQHQKAEERFSTNHDELMSETNRNIDRRLDKESTNTSISSLQQSSCLSTKENSSSDPSQGRQRRLFIGNLSPRMTSALVEKLFQPYGSVENVFLPNRRMDSSVNVRKSLTNQRQHAGGSFYALVTMASVDEANAAIAGLHGRTLLSQRLVVQPAKNETSNNTNPNESAAIPNAVKNISLTALRSKIQGLKEALRQDRK